MGTQFDDDRIVSVLVPNGRAKNLRHCVRGGTARNRSLLNSSSRGERDSPYARSDGQQFPYGIPGT